MSNQSDMKDAVVSVYKRSFTYLSRSKRWWKSVTYPAADFISSYSPFFGASVRELSDTVFALFWLILIPCTLLVTQFILGAVDVTAVMDFPVLQLREWSSIVMMLSAAVSGVAMWSGTRAERAVSIAVGLLAIITAVGILPPGLVVPVTAAAVYTAGVFSAELLGFEYSLTRAKLGDSKNTRRNQSYENVHDTWRFFGFVSVITIAMGVLTQYDYATTEYAQLGVILTYAGSYLISRRLYADVKQTMPYIDADSSGVVWIVLSRAVPLFGILAYLTTPFAELVVILPAFGSSVAAVLFGIFMSSIQTRHGGEADAHINMYDNEDKKPICDVEVDISHEDKQIQRSTQQKWHGTLRLNADIDIGVEADQSAKESTYTRALQKFMLFREVVNYFSDEGDESRRKADWVVRTMASHLDDFRDEYDIADPQEIPEEMEEEIRRARLLDEVTADDLTRSGSNTIDFGAYN